MRLLAAAIALACLTGCVSPEEWHRRDTVACVHYWFSPGIDSMASCMMTREEGRRVGIGLLPLQPPQQPNMDAAPLPQAPLPAPQILVRGVGGVMIPLP